MNIYVDIDNTITHTDGMNYVQAVPIKKRIMKINELYDQGNTITYWTARGVVSKINWKTLTTAQLKKWGAKYHHLLLTKPPFDIFIDDKAFNSENYFKS
jgi:hypothetical protein